MDYGDHLEAVEREVDSITDALRAGPLDPTVPTCPDWSVRDLASHLGDFAVFWTHILCEATGRAKTDPAELPDSPSAVADWFRGLGGSLVTELRATPPDTEIWTWVDSDKHATFAGRRAAHELAVHRFDVQLARGPVDPIDAALAADGIDEIFVMLSARGVSGAATGQTMHLHGTDRPDEWLVTLQPDGVDVAHEHAKGDLALRGAVSDLELTLYQRPPFGEVEQFGDLAVLDAFYDEFTFGGRSS